MDKIKFLLQRLLAKNNIMVHAYDRFGKILYMLNETNTTDVLQNNDALYNELIEIWDIRKKPVINMDETSILFGLLGDDIGNCYIIGPVAVDYLTRTQIYNYKKMHNINGKDLIVPYIDIDTMLNIMTISNTMINGTIISEEEIISYSIKTAKHFKPDEEDDLKYKLEKMEADLNHISYAEERMFTDAVKNADLEMIDKIKNSIESERMGRLATASRKQNEYVTVCIITLITRAAIEGGMSPSEAYNLSDLYLQKLEKCTNIVEMLYLQKNALDDFVRFVKISRDQQKSSDFIELCKDYIGKNIFQTIKVENIAREVGLNPSYVSRKFSEQVGMTIQNYILRERVQLAKNMLKYSESDIVEISEYLCFCSQSHFGSVFRKYTGQTPSEYRKENKIREFIP